MVQFTASASHPNPSAKAQRDLSPPARAKNNSARAGNFPARANFFRPRALSFPPHALFPHPRALNRPARASFLPAAACFSPARAGAFQSCAWAKPPRAETFRAGSPVNVVGTRDGTWPLPPNRTGGSPASIAPDKGFAFRGWSASTRGPLPRTAAHGAQTVHSACGGAPPPARQRPVHAAHDGPPRERGGPSVARRGELLSRGAPIHATQSRSRRRPARAAWASEWSFSCR